MDNNEIGKDIRAIRQSLNMNQTEFSQAIDVSQASISKWESGKEVPRADVMGRIRALWASKKGQGEPDAPVMLPIPLVGHFRDGGVMREYRKKETLTVPIPKHMSGDSLQFWLVTGHYEDSILPRQFFGLFSIVGDDLPAGTLQGRGKIALVTRAVDEKIEGLIMKIYPSKQSGASLWPIGYGELLEATPPVYVDEKGVSTSPGTTFEGVMVGQFSVSERTLLVGANPLEDVTEY